MRGRFFRRVAFLLAMLFVLCAGAMALVLGLAAAALRLVDTSGLASFPWIAALLGVLLGLGVLAVGRALTRLAHPAGDLMEATGRIAEGNYAVRVAEHGPPELRRLVRAFNTMAERLEAHEQTRRNLLADVSHELRTPLAVIQGNLEGLIDGVYSRDDAHLQTVLEEARILSALVEDLRTLALAESGALPLHREPTDLGTLVRDATAAFQARAESAGVGLSVEAAPDLPALAIDPVRIRQVVAILLTNALQHTPAGGSIRVSAGAASDGGRTEASVAVADDGSGIAPEDLPRVFDRFSKSRDSRGSGLGLAIARNLVAAHGGRISAESAPGRGTTVRFSLPPA
jgi:two-component system sensor histidine kinase BaeS